LCWIFLTSSVRKIHVMLFPNVVVPQAFDFSGLQSTSKKYDV
jgi:hypothetical protein